jgi:hypothetical protein
MEALLINGNLKAMTVDQRLSYYAAVCESLGLNPLTRPFGYLELNGGYQLYALKSCTDQLRAIRGVSITIIDRSQVGDLYIVTARATMADGRTDEDVGAVSTGRLQGEQLANGVMKAHTKAKRRATLGIVGLSVPDESEIDSIPGAVRLREAPDGTLGAAHASPTPAPAEPPPARAPAKPWRTQISECQSLAELDDVETRLAAALAKKKTAEPADVKQAREDMRAALVELANEPPADVVLPGQAVTR